MKTPNSTKFKPSTRNTWLGGSVKEVDKLTKKETGRVMPIRSPGQIIVSANGKDKYEVQQSGALKKV